MQTDLSALRTLRRLRSRPEELSVSKPFAWLVYNGLVLQSVVLRLRSRWVDSPILRSLVNRILQICAISLSSPFVILQELISGFVAAVVFETASFHEFLAHIYVQLRGAERVIDSRGHDVVLKLSECVTSPAKKDSFGPGDERVEDRVDDTKKHGSIDLFLNEKAATKGEEGDRRRIDLLELPWRQNVADSADKGYHRSTNLSQVF